ncbi:MAG: hypothetical protein RLZZ91_308 [Bacteroidota bacterium]|jgi:uncharacterized protein YdhG (YjbR/CyaY superfamily)
MHSEIKSYISKFPKETQDLLKKLHNLILAEAPDATVSISYGMPAYKTFKKPLVYFGGYEKHIGLYATPSGHEEFKKDLSAFKQGKGSVQFPLNQPMPFDLIRRIVRFRVEENRAREGKRR